MRTVIPIHAVRPNTFRFSARAESSRAIAALKTPQTVARPFIAFPIFKLRLDALEKARRVARSRRRPVAFVGLAAPLAIAARRV